MALWQEIQSLLSKDPIEELSPQDLERGGWVGILPLLPRIEEDRWFPSNTESQRFESVSESGEVQDGNTSVHPQGSSPGPLDGVSGSERCLSAHSNPNFALKVSEVCVEGLSGSPPHLPVECVTFRLDHGSQGF